MKSSFTQKIPRKIMKDISRWTSDPTKDERFVEVPFLLFR